MVSIIGEIGRPPFFVELASDDFDLKAWEHGALFGFSKKRSILPRSSNPSPQAVSDICYSIRSDPKTQEHFPNGWNRTRICGLRTL
jgi:hypothetical protein